MVSFDFAGFVSKFKDLLRVGGRNLMEFGNLAEQFWEQGFVFVEPFFQPDEMDRLCNLIFKKLGESPNFMHDAEFLKKSKADVIPWFPQ